MPIERMKTSASPKPPLRPQANGLILLGGIMASLGLVNAVVALNDAWGLGLITLAGGAVFVGLGLYLRSIGGPIQSVNRAYDALTRGELAEAEASLEAAEAGAKASIIRRAIDAQRALIALKRGDLEGALARADQALSRPLGVLSSDEDRLQVVGTHGIRALVRASRGDAPGARADIASVRADPLATPETLARAELAEAVVLERSGDRDALRAHLVGARRILLEHALPRERALVRAYQRMLEVRPASIYRKGPREPARREREQLSVAEWIAIVDPDAASFVPSEPVNAGAPSRVPTPIEPIDPAARNAAKARIAARPLRSLRLPLLWVVCIMFFLGIWQFLAPASSPDPEIAPAATAAADPSMAWTVAAPALAIVVGLGVFFALRAHGRKQARRLVAAMRALARGDEEAGESELRALAKSRSPVMAPQAWLQLAVLSSRRAEWTSAIDACDRGLAAFGRNNTSARAVLAVALVPSILAERAFLLAVTDRDAESRAELSLMDEVNPSFHLRSLAELRVALIRHVRRGDLEGAARLAESRLDDMPLGLRDEVLADLVRGVVHPESAGPGEIERLKRELRVDAELGRWLAAAAPELLAKFTSIDAKDASSAALADRAPAAIAEIHTPPLARRIAAAGDSEASAADEEAAFPPATARGRGDA